MKGFRGLITLIFKLSNARQLRFLFFLTVALQILIVCILLIYTAYIPASSLDNQRRRVSASIVNFLISSDTILTITVN